MIDKFSGEFGFLSNFYSAPIVVEEIEFPTAEHAYQAFKTYELWEWTAIKNAKTPGEAKKLGRKVTLRKDWEEIKLEVMEQLLRIKFAILEMKKRLLDTGDEELVEGNFWNDCFWGVCNGKGENNLGKLLMKIREDLRKE